MMKTATQVGRPQRRGDGWFVPSGQVGYFVEWLSEGRWRCTCASFRWRQRGTGTCKHIDAVQKVMRGWHAS
jgi:hypothetical protein